MNKKPTIVVNGAMLHLMIAEEAYGIFEKRRDWDTMWNWENARKYLDHTTGSPTEEEIRACAHDIWERNKKGGALADWAQAEKVVTERLNSNGAITAEQFLRSVAENAFRISAARQERERGPEGDWSDAEWILRLVLQRDPVHEEI